jgi:LPS-assembly lipoprotein
MRNLVLVILSLSLAACGFHLRKAAALPFETLYVDSSGAPALGIELARAVRSGSTTRLTNTPAEAEAVLQVMNEGQERRILSLSGGGKVREYQLFYRVAFRVLDRQKQELLAPQQIELKRDLTYDDSQVLAKEAEAALLYNDMRIDAVQQIMRRVSRVKLSMASERLPAAQP